MASTKDRYQKLFDKLKPICVPLLDKSQLAPQNVFVVLQLLSVLEDTLAQHDGSTLSANLASYVFFPLSTILRRNPSSDIPDQVMERMLRILSILCRSWWWTGELEIWSQMFMLCNSVVGGGLEGKGKSKARSDETKEAAAQCLLALLHERTDREAPPETHSCSAQQRLAQFQEHAHATQFLPVMGQSVDFLLSAARSPHRGLQRIALQLLKIILSIYAPTRFIPSVFPGVVSTMTQVALDLRGSKSWANGEVVAGALIVIQKVVVLAVGDAVCIADGLVRNVVDLEDFARAPETEPQPTSTSAPYLVIRTSSWLKASASQLHIALNTLTPLINHPALSALTALASVAKEILAATLLTLPQSQSLLLTWLLALSNSSYPQISTIANGFMVELLSLGSVRHPLLQALAQIAKDGLGSLPRWIGSQADSKVEHIAGQVNAICRLAGPTTSKSFGSSSLSNGLNLLLGPSGGIERWGWTFLAVLEFKAPPVTAHYAPGAQLFLETNTKSGEKVIFPEVTFKNILSRSASDALAGMFRALGRASGDNCLYAIEWFVSTGRTSGSHTAATALWCATRLLEGAAGTSLDSEDQPSDRITIYSKRFERFTRGLARDIAELWTIESAESTGRPSEVLDDESLPHTEFKKGLSVVRATVDITEPRRLTPPDFKLSSQPLLHKTFCLHLLAISASILQANFTSLLVHVLYPILHSVVSPIPHLSLTALATLTFIANATSYASPANLLFSHFDYALDAVSRRLGRRWLDVDATKVLVILVRLIGSDVVQKAGDVVEECFDRLDEYHGYEVLVEGLIEVLGEVVNVIEHDEPHVLDAPKEDPLGSLKVQDLDSLLNWVSHRNDPPEEYDGTDYGPAPRQAWGDLSKDDDGGQENEVDQERNFDEEEPLTLAQNLAKQMVSRSIYFLTHGSPTIRARILFLLKSATPVLSESALLPYVHQAWPYILNRLSDPETFVVSTAAALIESLVSHVGGFMGRRVWDDIWPRFTTILTNLEAADGQSALARRDRGAVGTASAYTHSHRLYRSILKTMTKAVVGIHMRNASAWEVILLFRRFLHRGAHEELQACARELYTALAKSNEDAVWLALRVTSGRLACDIAFLEETRWDIDNNMDLILREGHHL